MWHVLNINRRVEAAEAAIQGMTNLIDNINSDLYEMRSNNSSEVIRTQSPSLGKVTLFSQIKRHVLLNFSFLTIPILRQIDFLLPDFST